MSKWVEIRDSLLGAMQVKDVGNKVKEDFISWLTTEGIEFAQSFADEVAKECKHDAPNETGWCKIRDGVVLPVALNVGIYILRTVLTKAAAEGK